MDEKIINVPIERLIPDPANERARDQKSEREMGESLKANGQLDPGTGYEDGKGNVHILDAHRRFYGAQHAGMKSLKMRIVPEPTPAERAVIRACSDIHKKKFLPSERMAVIHNAATLNKWSPTEAARKLGLDQGVVSKNLLTHERATAALKKRFDEGAIDLEAAYTASQLPPEQQDALAGMPVMPKRDQLKGMVKQNGKPGAKVSSVTIPLQGGYTLMAKGPIHDMPCLVQLVAEAKTQLSRAMAKGHDPKSLRNYFKKFPPEQKAGE